MYICFIFLEVIFPRASNHSAEWRKWISHASSFPLQSIHFYVLSIDEPIHISSSFLFMSIDLLFSLFENFFLSLIFLFFMSLFLTSLLSTFYKTYKWKRIIKTENFFIYGV